MGVYGDFLAPFAELFENYPIVKCEPKIGGGYETTTVGLLNGYIQDGESGLNVRDNYSRNSMSSGSAAGIVSELSVKYLYTREPVNLYGNFILYEGSPYRPMVDSDYRKEGNLVVTELHKVVGDTGLNEKVVNIIKGAFG